MFKLKKEKKNNIKKITDKLFRFLFLFLLLIAASIIIISIIFILIKGIQPFINNYSTGDGEIKQSLYSFFFSSRWTYDGNGGMIFLLLTTFLIVILSLLISAPISIFTALFISRIAPKTLKVVIKSAIDLLASIPSVIFGLFGMGVINKLVLNIANLFNTQTFGGKSILSGALVLAIMIMPTITTLSISAIDSVDNSLVLGSLALGASKAQTNYKIVLKSAKSGIFAGIILGVGRALGEATALQMVIGNGSEGSTFYNIFGIGSTLTTSMLTGLGEASGIGYDVRFSLGIVLMIVIIFTNLLLNYIKNFNDDSKNIRSKKFFKMIKTKIRGLFKDE